MFETVPVLQILVCVVVGVLAAGLPFLKRAPGFLLLSLLGVITIYRQSAVGYVLTNVLVFTFTATLARMTKESAVKRKLRWRWTTAALLALIAAFIIGRVYQLDSKPVSIGGVQWILFSLDMWLLLRLVTFLWEFGSGRIDQPSLLAYAVWAFMPFTVLGPVLRYSQFEPQLPWLHPTKNGSVYSKRWLLKLGAGALLIIAGAALSRLHQTIYAEGGAGLPLWAKLLDGFGVSPWSFLLLWSGYYYLIECLALLWGVSLPPSFNWPFGRANISEFWANWNMSATSVFRDYMFYNRWGLARPNYYLNTLLIFLAVGLWHAVNWYWVLWGLLHGIGFCMFIWYRQRRDLKRHEIEGVPHRLFSRVVTYIFVCSCWILPSRILKLLGQV